MIAELSKAHRLKEIYYNFSPLPTLKHYPNLYWKSSIFIRDEASPVFCGYEYFQGLYYNAIKLKISLNLSSGVIKGVTRNIFATSSYIKSVLTGESENEFNFFRLLLKFFQRCRDIELDLVNDLLYCRWTTVDQQAN